MGFHDSTGTYRVTRTEYIRLFIANGILAAGTPLAAFANGASTTPGLAFDNSKACGVRWNNDAAPAKFIVNVPSPVDRKPGTDATLVITAAKSGATPGDVVTFTVEAFNQDVAALQDADTDFGGITSPMTAAATAKTVQRVTLALASANLAAAPSMMTVSIKPTAGTLGTDDVTIHGAWLQYERAISDS